MKKILLVILALGVLPLAASAEDKSDGCGLGWQITQKTSFLATTTRGTTNAFIPPTFGMTSGTIGCAQHSIAKAEQPAVIFVLSNYDALTVEMAEGRGEFLEGFARTMGCSDRTQAAFGRMTQSNFKTLIQDGKTSPVQMYQNVKEQIRKDPVLSLGCTA